jgi:lysozyme
MGLRQARLLISMLALGAALLAAAPAPAAAKPGRLGIDVSRFNGAIDWVQVADAGVQFAFVAAGRGNGTDCAVKPNSCGADPNYAANYAGARAAGVRVGAYHRAFIAAASREELLADARAEADVFVANVGALRPGDLRPALDVETPFEVTGPGELRLWIRKWLKRVGARLGVRPIVYTNSTSWAATGSTVEFAKAGHPLWVANWGVRKPIVPAEDWAGRGWWIWQFTSSGSVPGILGRVDMNKLRVRFSLLSVR